MERGCGGESGWGWREWVWWGEGCGGERPYLTLHHLTSITKPTYVGQRLCPNLLMSVRDCAQTYLCRSETGPKPTHVGQRTLPKPTDVGQRLGPNLLMSGSDCAQTYSCRIDCA